MDVFLLPPLLASRKRVHLFAVPDFRMCLYFLTHSERKQTVSDQHSAICGKTRTVTDAITRNRLPTKSSRCPCDGACRCVRFPHEQCWNCCCTRSINSTTYQSAIFLLPISSSTYCAFGGCNRKYNDVVACGLFPWCFRFPRSLESCRPLPSH